MIYPIVALAGIALLRFNTAWPQHHHPRHEERDFYSIRTLSVRDV
jgi:hypothetical protein